MTTFATLIFLCSTVNDLLPEREKIERNKKPNNSIKILE
jgi:hypothetical protein